MLYRVTETTPSTGEVLRTWTFLGRNTKAVVEQLEQAGAPDKTVQFVRHQGVPRRVNWETHARKVVVVREGK